MMILGKRHGSDGKILTAGCLLVTCVLLSACKHSSSSTVVMDSKGLWIANGANVVEYIPSQLTAGVAATVPHLAINSAEFGAPQGVTFDSAGNLWVMDVAGTVNGVKDTPALFKFSAAQLAALGTNAAPDPVATITATSMAAPQQSVFDAAGNQWVANHDANAILVFTAAQLALSGDNPTVPALTLSSPSFNGPLGIAFDSAGNLWVANNGGVAGANGAAASPAGTTIVEFAASHLAVPATGTLTPDLTPDITLTDDGNGSIQAPLALAFDASGDLWSSNANAPSTLVEFSKAQLTASAMPVPAITISPVTDMGNVTLAAPNGLCFDPNGDLAAASSATPFGFPIYGKGQLATGAVIPSTFIVGAATTLNATAGCNFGPVVN